MDLGAAAAPEAAGQLVERQCRAVPGARQMGGGGVASGTYELEMGKDDFVFIYAEDNDGTAFNCSLEAGAPSAIRVTCWLASWIRASSPPRLLAT